MKTEIVVIDENNIDISKIKKAAKIIKDGGVVAFPTETVYGLGANAFDEKAVKKIFIAKGRPQDNPLIVHIQNVCELEDLVYNIPEVAKKLMNKFFPGPITIILNKKDSIPDVTSAGLKTIGIRMPNNKVALTLIKEAGVPIAAPSANISGRPSPTDVERCIEDLDGRVDGILGGSCSEIGVESTIVDCTVHPPCVLRPGGITLEQLREIDSDIYMDKAIMQKPSKDLKPKAPGMKYRHYAPKAPVKIIEGNMEQTIAKINEMLQYYIDDKKKVGILACDETKNNYKDGIVVSLGSLNNMQEIASNLFETLRYLDDLDVDIILSESFEEKGIGVAIMNRLRKAAGFNIYRV